MPSRPARRKAGVVPTSTQREQIVEQLVGGVQQERKETAVVTELERQSPLWLKLKAHMEKRIASLRARNDNDRNAEDTAKLRGRIAELKLIATLDNPAVAMEPDKSE